MEGGAALNLSPLKYKDYTWPCNPRTYSLRFEKNTVIHSYPYTNINEVDDLGNKPREISGEGEFVGEGAYDEFKKLASVFYKKGPGSLTHPIWQISQAIFNRLELEQEPTPNYVRYTFGFIEDTSENEVKEKKQVTQSKPKDESKPKPSTKSHIVKQGDTMWAIAKRNGISLNDLVDKNPQIKNPNLIYPGNKINL